MKQPSKCVGMDTWQCMADANCSWVKKSKTGAKEHCSAKSTFGGKSGAGGSWIKHMQATKGSGMTMDERRASYYAAQGKPAPVKKAKAAGTRAKKVKEAPFAARQYTNELGGEGELEFGEGLEDLDLSGLQLGGRRKYARRY